jgi:hypothetical protein
VADNPKKKMHDLKKKMQYYMLLINQAAASRSTVDLRDTLSDAMEDGLPAHFKRELVQLALGQAASYDWPDGLRTAAKGFAQHLGDKPFVAPLYAAITPVFKDGGKFEVAREWMRCFSSVEISEDIQHVVADTINGRAVVFEIVKPLLKSQRVLDDLMDIEKYRWNRPMVIALLRAGATYSDFWKAKITQALKEDTDTDLEQVVNAIELARELEITEGMLAE